MRGSISGGKTNVKPFVEMHDQYRYGTGRISIFIIMEMKKIPEELSGTMQKMQGTRERAGERDRT